MADRHPYISGAGNISKMISYLRSSFPKTVTSATIKKLGLAPNNESYLLNILQFMKIIDEKGNKITEAGTVFFSHSDDEFKTGLSSLVEKAYHALFDLHGEKTWELEIDKLISFFRNNDQTSDAVGKLQASTFKNLAGLSGHGELRTKTPNTKNAKSPSKTKPQKASPKNQNLNTDLNSTSSHKLREVGLTVRIEINLPSDGTKETYDNIFKSIKENLIDG